MKQPNLWLRFYFSVYKKLLNVYFTPLFFWSSSWKQIVLYSIFNHSVPSLNNFEISQAALVKFVPCILIINIITIFLDESIPSPCDCIINTLLTPTIPPMSERKWWLKWQYIKVASKEKGSLWWVIWKWVTPKITKNL